MFFTALITLDLNVSCITSVLKAVQELRKKSGTVVSPWQSKGAKHSRYRGHLPPRKWPGERHSFGDSGWYFNVRMWFTRTEAVNRRPVINRPGKSQSAGSPTWPHFKSSITWCIKDAFLHSYCCLVALVTNQWQLCTQYLCLVDWRHCKLICWLMMNITALAENWTKWVPPCTFSVKLAHFCSHSRDRNEWCTALHAALMIVAFYRAMH